MENCLKSKQTTEEEQECNGNSGKELRQEDVAPRQGQPTPDLLTIHMCVIQ
ncbi:hypothetical protein BgiMline_018429, partial [Biomphalaria glabrata]